MRTLLLMLPAFAALLAAAALMAAPSDDVPRGRMAHQGLDHWEQSEPPPQLQPAPPPGEVVEVALRGAAYEPAALSAPPGPVRFVNRDAVAHTLTGQAEGGAALVDRVLQPGEAATLELAPGTYALRCRYHSASYEDGPMRAQLTVG